MLWLLRVWKTREVGEWQGEKLVICTKGFYMQS